MLLICLAGFYFFHKVPRPLEAPLMLDIVLLGFASVGPLVYDIFTMIAVMEGDGNEATAWGVTASRALIDIFSSFLQVSL